jgi:hypothetical protein
VKGKLRAGVEESRGKRHQNDGIHAFSERVQDQGNAREPEQDAGNGAQSEGDSKKPTREQWAEQGTGIIKQHTK